MADDTVTAARAELDERLERAFDGATPAQITAAIDALIAAVRAESVQEIERLRVRVSEMAAHHRGCAGATTSAPSQRQQRQRQKVQTEIDRLKSRPSKRG